MVVGTHHLNQIYGDHYANKPLEELQVDEAVTGPVAFLSRFIRVRDIRHFYSNSRQVPPFRFYQIKLCGPSQWTYYLIYCHLDSVRGNDVKTTTKINFSYNEMSRWQSSRLRLAHPAYAFKFHSAAWFIKWVNVYSTFTWKWIEALKFLRVGGDMITLTNGLPV